MEKESAGILATAIKTAALILAIAMLGSSIIDYFTFREPHYEEEAQEVFSVPL